MTIIEKQISHLLYQYVAVPATQQIRDQVPAQVCYQIKAQMWELLFDQLKVQVPNSIKESLKR